MSRILLRTLAGAVALAASALPAMAQSASFFVVHGVPGRDVGAGIDPQLPVDVLVNGQLCLIKNLTFGTIAGPYDVPPGTYTVAISQANPISPCSNSPVISGSVTLTNGEFAAAVAQLSPAGAPTLGAYAVDVSPIKSGNQRFVAIHAADAPKVDVTVQSTSKKGDKFAFKLGTGKEKTAEAPTQPGWDVTAAIGRAVVGPAEVSGADQTLFLVVAVGSAKSGSLTLISRTIPSVF